MFIPAQTPDLQLPLTQLLETKPVVPVTAVPGIPEDAQHLDSRVALQWAQPVLPGEKGQAARNALAIPLAVQLIKPLAIKGFEPQGPDPDALRKGEVHPMLSEGLASWINAVVTKSVPNFRPNPVLLQNTVIKNNAAGTRNADIEVDVESAIAGDVPVTKSSTVATASSSNSESLEHVAIAKLGLQKTNVDVMPVLLNLYKALTQSNIFAAQRLAESWLPRPVKAQEEAQAGERTDASIPRPTKANTSLLHLDENQQAFKALAQPASEPSMAQLAKWVNGLEPDSEPAQQAAQMLTHGQMNLLADLAPGVPMRMVREDAWRNDAQRPAQLEKGAMLRVELNLPNLGRIRVVGSQWGQEVSLQIAHDASSQDQWFAIAPDLLEELQAKGIGDVRLEALPNQDEVENG